MTNESAVLLRAGAVLAMVWLARTGVMKAGHERQSLDRRTEFDAIQGPASAEASRLASARGSDLAKSPTISSVVPSTLPAGGASTVRISGRRLSGAFVTGSRGMLVTGVQMEVDTLVLDIFVDAMAMPGPATLTLVTGAGAVTVPITITASHVPVIAAGAGARRDAGSR
jgi:hypothetical protein